MGLNLKVNIYLKINLDSCKVIETLLDSKYYFLKKVKLGLFKHMIMKLI